jgi:hypothetical protein
MTIEQLQERLGKWNQFLCVNLGASLVLLAISLTDALNARRERYYRLDHLPDMYVPGWHFV